MSAKSITVVIEAHDDAGRNFAGLEINAKARNWRRNETPSAAKIFKAKNGLYRVLKDTSGLGSVTELLGLSMKRVGKLLNFDPSLVVNGATGQGLSDDTGRAINWKVDGISNA